MLEPFLHARQRRALLVQRELGKDRIALRLQRLLHRDRERVENPLRLARPQDLHERALLADVCGQRFRELGIGGADLRAQQPLERREQAVGLVPDRIGIEPPLRLLEGEHADSQGGERIGITLGTRCVREQLGDDRRIIDDEIETAYARGFLTSSSRRKHCPCYEIIHGALQAVVSLEHAPGGGSQREPPARRVLLLFR